MFENDVNSMWTEVNDIRNALNDKIGWDDTDYGYTIDELFGMAVNGGGGSDGQRGSQWFSGTAMSGTSTTANYYSYSGASNVLVGDYYLNTSYGYVYRCTTAGSGTSAKWTYQGSIRGASGSSIKGDKGDKGDKGADASTIVVAASNSKNKSTVDYQCTGSGDQSVITSAVNALPSAGGKVILLEGTYNFSSYPTISKSNVIIEGMGAATVINSTANTIGLRLTNASYVTLANMKFTGFSYTVAVQSSCNHITIRDCIFVDNTAQGINLDGATYNTVIGNYCINCGIGIDVYGAASHNVIVGNHCTDNTQGLYLAGSYNICVGNDFSGNTNSKHMSGSGHVFDNNIE